MEPKRTTEHTKTLKDHILTNSPEKAINSDAIEMRLSDHNFVTVQEKHHHKMNTMKFHLGQWKVTHEKFPENLNHICTGFPARSPFVGDSFWPKSPRTVWKLQKAVFLGQNGGGIICQIFGWWGILETLTVWTMPTRTLSLGFYLQSILFHQLELWD